MRFVRPCSSATGRQVRGVPHRSNGTWQPRSWRPQRLMPCLPIRAAPFWRRLSRRIGEGSGALANQRAPDNLSMRVIEFRVSAQWALARIPLGEKSAGEFLARRPRRIAASFQHDSTRLLPEGLSVGRSLGVATPSGHGLQGKSPWTRRRRPAQLWQQPRAAIWFAARDFRSIAQS